MLEFHNHLSCLVCGISFCGLFPCIPLFSQVLMSKAPPAPDLGKMFAAARKALGVPANFGTAAVVTGFCGIVGYGIYQGIYFVPGGFRAVKFNAITGLHDKVYGEGANLAIPYIENPVLFDIRHKPYEVTSASGSRDLQIINIAVRILYAPHADNLPELYRRLGYGYADTVLTSITNEVMRAVIAQYNANELLVKRAEVSSRIAEHLRSRASGFNIDISDVSITQMTFGKEYTAAVEAKQVAQQMAERAKFRVDQAQQEKRGMIVLAEGEAESAKLIGSAMQNNPAFLELRRLEAAKVISKALAHSQGQYYLDSESLMMNAIKPVEHKK